jgi:hypothetical protein
MRLESAELHGRRAVHAGGIVGALLASALACALACASQQTVVVWEKPGASAEELEAAREACLAEVEALQTRGVNRMRVEADATGACFVACMKRHGFTWRTEKVSTRAPRGAQSDALEGQEPFDSPLPPPPECSVPPDDGRDGS